VRQPSIRATTGIHHYYSRLQGYPIHGGEIVGIDDEYVTLI
jgi:hypothetical protein